MSRVVFCGVGALGSQAAISCRNLGVELVFVDFDRVESKNVLAQAFVKQSIGKNKADALKAQMANFYGTKCEAFGVRVTESNVEALLSNADLIIDAFDNAASRAILSTFARAKNKALLHAAISADGTFGLVRWDERFTPDTEDHAGQATCEGGEHLPMIAMVASTLARAIQDYVKDNSKHDSMISLSGVLRQ
jgi:molybdopterin-synthase adenylyltransferase